MKSLVNSCIILAIIVANCGNYLKNFKCFSGHRAVQCWELLVIMWNVSLFSVDSRRYEAITKTFPVVENDENQVKPKAVTRDNLFGWLNLKNYVHLRLWTRYASIDVLKCSIKLRKINHCTHAQVPDKDWNFKLFFFQEKSFKSTGIGRWQGNSYQQ